MSRYIDADALDDLITQLNSEGRHITRTEYKMIDNILFEIPTADVVEVVRCKDCKFWQDNNGGYPNMNCRWIDDETPDEDDFCSYGERREDGTLH